MEATYNVKQAATYISKSPSALRGWCKVFADQLSDGATPAKGQPRRFNDSDLAILLTIAILKERQQSKEAIIELLVQGQRLEREREFVPDLSSDQSNMITDRLTEPEASPQMALAKNDIIKPYMMVIEELKGERDYLRQQLEEARKPWYKKLFR